MPLKHTILPLFLFLLAACSRHEPVEIVRLDLAPSDSLVELRNVWRSIAGPSADGAQSAFAGIVGERLAPLDSVERVLALALGNERVKFVGVINPYRQPIAVSDSLIFIGLNHYLGEDCEAYKGFPEYQRRLKTIERLPVDVVEEFVYDKYKTTEIDEPTLLKSILYVGTVHNLALKFLPEETSEALVLGMTEQELEWCRENEQRIWQKLVEEKLLYSGDGEVIDRLMRPSPAATMINLNAPGATAHYIGLQIARAYEKNSGEAAFPTAEYVNNSQTLIKSKYAPQNATR